MERGIYVSRKDRIGSETVTTFDVRMKLANREPVLGAGALHTLEHLVATWLRNNDTWKERIIYWGPMGCATGNYLLVKGDLQPEDVEGVLLDAFRFVRNFEGEVPGTTPKDCGTCLLHDLPMAKYEAAKYVEVLENMEEKNRRYPV